MTKKDEKKPESIEATNTASVQTDSFLGAQAIPIQNLLGEAALRLPSQPKALIRLCRDDVDQTFLESLQLGDLAFLSIRPPQFVPIILGPFELETIKDWVTKRYLLAPDMILTGFGRWKTVRVVFPELHGVGSGEDDLTNTATMESTGSITTDMELEKSGVDEVVAPSLEPALEYAKQQKGALPSVVDSRGIDATSSLNSETTKKSGSRQNSHPSRPSVVTAGRVYAVVAVLILTIVGLYKYKTAERPPADWLNASQEAQQKRMREWPEALQPLPRSALYNDSESPLLERLRPILTAYERGATVLSSQDERTLKSIADPAAASWEARRLAANQLMVFYLAKSRLIDARRVLQPILEDAPSDPTTLLNDALLKFAEGDLSQARDVASVAVRLAPAGLLWVAHAILGLVNGASGRADEVDKNFVNAVGHSANNPFIYGIWIQSLLKSESAAARNKIPQLLKDALWSDPDRLVDSPIRAPIAGHLLMAEALAGLRRGAELYANQMSPGQVAFIRSLEARSALNPLSESLHKTVEILSRESGAQSQLLYAYLLNENAQTDQASEVLTRVIPLLESQRVMHSWPWTFAGDIQSARSQGDQALLYYQAALSRNAQDSGAALGLALAFRDEGDYKAAQQKLAESLSLDPLFIPALLRVNRFEWHRRAKVE